jgi:transposase
LQHREEAEKFYRELVTRRVAVRVGMEASGHARWLERLLKELQFELWIGDAAEIQTKRARKQKTDRQDAQLILKLLLDDRFPRSGFRVQEIVIYVSCFGIGIAWCKRARGS